MREPPIKQWNAVTYLYDFIEKNLPLTPEESKVFQIAEQLKIEEKSDWQLNRDLRAKGYVLCKECGEIKPVSEFYGTMRYCKDCYNKRRKLNIKENRYKEK
jgi:hypothetical protein